MKLTALAGGVGAAKLLWGLAKVIPPQDLTVIVNTGDDFRCYGLNVCPDLDTIAYTLAGLENPDHGWGLRDESFRCLERLGELGCDTWFQLGDRDLATHIFRTHRLECGDSLTKVTAALSSANGIQSRILPMADIPIPTMIHTHSGILSFQDYFVRRNCAPDVLGLSFSGIEKALPAPGVLEAIQGADAVVICPSNPFISIGPILEVPGIRNALRTSPAVTVAVTPIVAGAALKGPSAEMMRHLGFEVSAFTVARLYGDFLDIFLLDQQDAGLRERIAELGLTVHMTDTVMSSMEAKMALAQTVMDILSRHDRQPKPGGGG
jgi:LPPG:FO 2-phospho-L-lactate transferase